MSIFFGQVYSSETAAGEPVDQTKHGLASVLRLVDAFAPEFGVRAASAAPGPGRTPRPERAFREAQIMITNIIVMQRNEY